MSTPVSYVAAVIENNRHGPPDAKKTVDDRFRRYMEARIYAEKEMFYAMFASALDDWKDPNLIPANGGCSFAAIGGPNEPALSLFR